MTLCGYIKSVESGTISPGQVLDAYIKKAKEKNSQYNAFLRFHDEYIQKNKETFMQRRLHGAPIGIKDIIMQEGVVVSCGSKMMQEYVAPYSATCIERLEQAGGLPIGSTNMDEFAMGTSGESSAFGPAINPYGTRRVPGGSSSGSAVAVAADMCIAALGTDTGGSIRLPASFCNIVGLKPTYGRVSRYGVVPLCNSIDQVGTFTKTVEDAELLLRSIAGYDERDATSSSGPQDPAKNWIYQQEGSWRQRKIADYNIAIVKETFGEGLATNVKEVLMGMIEKLRCAGAQITEVSLPLLMELVPVYYIILPAEVSTNLARFDGIRYGLQDDTFKYKTIHEYYAKVRTEGFGDEVIRRILTGTFVLSSANYEGYYVKAKKIQAYFQKQIEEFFSEYDAILLPTCPEVARELGSVSDPLKLYLADVYNIPANICHVCAISVPCGFAEDKGEKMPVGMQIMANKWREDVLFGIGKKIQELNEDFEYKEDCM